MSMRIEQLTVKKAASYESNAGNYVGKVKLEDQHGNSCEMNLSPSSISKIFAVIKTDASAISMRMASEMPSAIDDSSAQPLLLEEGEF